MREPQMREGYRNFLDIGALTIMEGPNALVLDQVADAVVTKQLEQAHRHMWYETTVNARKWHVEVSQRGALTAPPLGITDEEVAPVRDPVTPLAKDGKYWFAVYPLGWHMPTYPEDMPARTTPELHLDLMRHIAPHFPYSPLLSTAKRLIFVQQGEGEPAWALMIDKTSNSRDFRYPPQLILSIASRRKSSRMSTLFLPMRSAPGSRVMPARGAAWRWSYCSIFPVAVS
ncbi:hypothetical protein KW842_09730 [Duganella sp. sic0402]|uniref:hypothetical protein n=1 Tax=Duganella sp. sic0402 TaxID=2854786 RepID=UPI001C464C03|nr:hypothetical protein [Duganella sp. sic0402]MBV7536044.1 hypothetical protein [Duganella sp. sic0402]